MGLGCDKNSIINNENDITHQNELPPSSKTHSYSGDILWIDEKVFNDENTLYFQNYLQSYNIYRFASLNDELFSKFYKNDFTIIIVIISGKLFLEFCKKIEDNLEKIVNIPYTIIFTSKAFKEKLLNIKKDDSYEMSYDLIKYSESEFYCPGGIVSSIDKLQEKIKMLDIKYSEKQIEVDSKQKSYDGLFTFQYLNKTTDFLAPALFKDIISMEKINESEKQDFNNYILSFNNKLLNELFTCLKYFKYIPIEILCKYWIRAYTIESQFYKNLNIDLTGEHMRNEYKTYIKALYFGTDLNILKPYKEKKLYRGAAINNSEIVKIEEYKKNNKLNLIHVLSKAFLSFSQDFETAKKFCGKNKNNITGCIYELENENINEKVSNSIIKQYSYYQIENEILFFPGSSFIIKDIVDIGNKKKIILEYNGKFRENFYDLLKSQNFDKLISENAFIQKFGYYAEIIENRYIYKTLKEEGPFAEIYFGRDLKNEENVAIKVYKKNRYKENEIINGYKIQKELNNLDNIVKLKDYYNDKNSNLIFSVMDIYDDDLYNYFQREGHFSPNLIHKVFSQLNNVIEVMYEKKYNHRKICLKNILIKYTDEKKNNFNCFLGGFGIDRYYKHFTGGCGGYYKYYIAPEFTFKDFRDKEKFFNKSDLWSIGVCMHLLYYGHYPKVYDSDTDSYDSDDYYFGELELIDENLEDLINKLLVSEKLRISYEEYFNHPFFKQYLY